MVLAKSKSKAAVGKNIKQMVSSGHSKKQSLAAALNVASKSGKKIAPKKKK